MIHLNILNIKILYKISPTFILAIIFLLKQSLFGIKKYNNTVKTANENVVILFNTLTMK